MRNFETLEVGATYLNRLGEVVKIVHLNPVIKKHRFVDTNHKIYDKYGFYFDVNQTDHRDLIKKVEDAQPEPQTLEQMFYEFSNKLSKDGYQADVLFIDDHISITAKQQQAFKFKDLVMYNDKEYVFQRHSHYNPTKAYIIGEAERICVPVRLLTLV